MPGASCASGACSSVACTMLRSGSGGCGRSARRPPDRYYSVGLFEMGNVTIQIPRLLRGALPEVMAAHGYRTIVVDRIPIPINDVSTQQRYICGSWANAVVVTVTPNRLNPGVFIATIGSDFWLLARYWKITFDYVIVDKIAVVLAAVAWMIENAESESELEAVDRVLSGQADSKA